MLEKNVFCYFIYSIPTEVRVVDSVQVYPWIQFLRAYKQHI